MLICVGKEEINETILWLYDRWINRCKMYEKTAQRMGKYCIRLLYSMQTLFKSNYKLKIYL